MSRSLTNRDRLRALARAASSAGSLAVVLAVSACSSNTTSNERDRPDAKPDAKLALSPFAQAARCSAPLMSESGRQRCTS
jgi:hypothetical protein